MKSWTKSQKKSESHSLWFSLTIVVEASAIILVLQLAFRPLARSTFYKVWQPRPALVIDCNRSVLFPARCPFFCLNGSRVPEVTWQESLFTLRKSWWQRTAHGLIQDQEFGNAIKVQGDGLFFSVSVSTLVLSSSTRRIGDRQQQWFMRNLGKVALG